MPLTPLGGPFLGLKMSRSGGREEKLWQKKAKIRKKKKHRNMKNPHLFGGGVSWLFLTIKLGIFEIFNPNLVGLEPKI